jgi:hypothetical protein
MKHSLTSCSLWGFEKALGFLFIGHGAAYCGKHTGASRPVLGQYEVFITVDRYAFS